MADSSFLGGLFSTGQTIYHGQQITPIFQLCGWDDACPECQAKIGAAGVTSGQLCGVTGTYIDLLDANEIPPFHEHCRCWLRVQRYDLIPFM